MRANRAMYGMTAIVPAWCHTEVYAPAMTLVTTTKATATRRRLARGVDAFIVDAALTMDALTHGSKNRNSLWAASEYPKIVQNVTTNACGAARRFLKNPESAARRHRAHDGGIPLREVPVPRMRAVYRASTAEHVKSHEITRYARPLAVKQSVHARRREKDETHRRRDVRRREPRLLTPRRVSRRQERSRAQRHPQHPTRRSNHARQGRERHRTSSSPRPADARTERLERPIHPTPTSSDTPRRSLKNSSSRKRRRTNSPVSETPPISRTRRRETVSLIENTPRRAPPRQCVQPPGRFRREPSASQAHRIARGVHGGV